MIEVIDNFLDDYSFKSIQSVMMTYTFPWYTDTKGRVVAHKGGNDGIYFCHHFFNDEAKSEFMSFLSILIDKIPYDVKYLKRIKGNLYPSQKRKVFHDWHTDYPQSHKGCIFGINTNNGHTHFKNISRVKSVENRLILFDPSLEHRSTTCTDQPCRMNINFNYWPID